jgi:hypothetical protein
VRTGRSGAALLTLCTALALAAVSSAGQPATGPVPGTHAQDAGTASRARDAGSPLSAASRDGGGGPAALSAEDLEVVSNLELLEHLPESEVLDFLVPQRDE